MTAAAAIAIQTAIFAISIFESETTTGLMSASRVSVNPTLIPSQSALSTKVSKKPPSATAIAPAVARHMVTLVC